MRRDLGVLARMVARDLDEGRRGVDRCYRCGAGDRFRLRRGPCFWDSPCQGLGEDAAAAADVEVVEGIRVVLGWVCRGPWGCIGQTGSYKVVAERVHEMEDP